jgi:alpha-L-fucosidase
LAHQGSDADAAWLWNPVQLNQMVRKYNPDTVINPRSGWEGDFICNEGDKRVSGPIITEPWEKCLNLNKVSWGYNPEQNLMKYEEAITIRSGWQCSA